MTTMPDVLPAIDTEPDPMSAWLEVCLGLVDAPSLTEIELRLDRALTHLCRPQQWALTIDVEAGAAEASHEGSIQPPEQEHTTPLSFPLIIRGRDRGSLEIVPAPDYPITPEVMARLSSLTRSLTAGLHRLHQELHLRSHIGELAFVQSLLHEHLPISRTETHNPFSEAMLGLLGSSSFECIIPIPNEEGGYRVFSSRRASVALSTRKRQRLMRLVEDLFVKGGQGQQRFFLFELDDVQRLAEAYRLSYLSRLASLGIVPIHQGTTLLGALILGEERHPTRHPLARQALAACIPLARSMARATTRDRHLRALLDHGPFMRALIDRIDLGLMSVEQGIISSWNYAASELFGYQADEVVGKLLRDVLHAAPPGLLEPSISARPATTERQSFEWSLRAADGRDLLLDCSVATLAHHHSGEPIIMYAFREIGREREIEYLKDELLSSISHELRTPLSSIDGFTRLLQERPDLPAEMQRESLQLIKASTEQLSRIVEDFIDVARARRGHLPIALEPVQIEALIRAIISDIRPRYPKHDIVVLIARDLPIVDVDGLRIRQIFDNIIGNAATYSAEGTRISVRARRTDNTVAISISDQGIGIAPEVQDRIFEPFYRAENSRRYRAKGVGLGLSIVRSLVQAHGGELSVRSDVGRGATFTFSLPSSTTDVIGDE